MNQALKNPQVRDAMRDRNIKVRQVGNPGVLEVQRLLNAQGFGAGPPDGVLGDGTKRAISAFQRSIGRPATGSLTDDEFVVLQSGVATVPSIHVESPIVEVDVRIVQQRLSNLGFDPGPVDGAWGRRSQLALDQFRDARGIDTQGKPTLEDMRILDAALAPENATQPPKENLAEPPQLFALSVVDRGLDFRVAWSHWADEVGVDLLPIRSDLSHQFEVAKATMPVSLTAPAEPGLYHIVLLDIAGGKILARLPLEVR